MASQNDIGSSSMGKSQSHQPQLNSLARQGSLYSLTLDEVQHHLGEPLDSMNIDELLKSLSTVEANEGIEVADNGLTHFASNQQPSAPLSWDLSQKTVGEVLHGIQQGQNMNNLESNDQRYFNLAEITLEEFLIKSGVLAGLTMEAIASVFGINPMGLPHQIVQQQAPVMNFQNPSIHYPSPQQQQQQDMVLSQQPILIGAATSIETTYLDTQTMTTSSSALIGTIPDAYNPGRKRDASIDPMEQSIERKQKRMIKNRESAARSRARRQAYTNELENKVAHLEEENDRLKKKMEMEKILPTAPPPKIKYQLRRTSSAHI